ncbi:Os08g0402500 [Oryza sativa Japonica Group]|uniref:Os08g0402500 protein n=2 Tax=Oryza sativa subsp. japonica TaxID=39947 RepID=A0A0P0XFE0_ORYSJ|nr:hypothetical protein EE612_044150 [Oryza sativa]BAC98688.1 unknown protein [Oryza sativa Japonica Group]BAF23673.1 Os08g0402500 [Oryza sativa Japonica Group]BAT05348.1 Os08g0402500 [Oryza sativa Japonica Group]|eukprot:NP_001061759.1 Os08g0402500 [Oryza sativa Japonica Group]
MAVVQMLSWLSSGAAWFVFLNVIVGAIAVVSWLGQGVGGTTSTPSSAARRRLAPRSSPVAAATAAAIKNEEEEAEAEEEEESISLDEAYALAQQAQARSPRSAPDAAAAAKAADAKPRRARAEEVEEGKAEVNARAERFIKQFREDLKLQRINSIINYTNALRRRGAGGVAATAPAPAR